MIKNGIVWMGCLVLACLCHGRGPAQPHLARWTAPSDTGHYIGYYVGGGNASPWKAEPRLPHEGTWGWDYRGWIIPRRVNLGWWHGRRYQGGIGSYRTDGPLLFNPNN